MAGLKNKSQMMGGSPMGNNMEGKTLDGKSYSSNSVEMMYANQNGHFECYCKFCGKLVMLEAASHETKPEHYEAELANQAHYECSQKYEKEMKEKLEAEMKAKKEKADQEYEEYLKEMSKE